MIRLFNVYYPVRTLLLVGGEVVIVCASFLLATLVRLGPQSYLILNYENGYYKILAVSGLPLLCLYYSDMYDLERLRSQGEVFFRLLVVLGTVSLLLAAICYVFPQLMLGDGVFLRGQMILTVGLLGWRGMYAWLIRQPYLRERIYVLGSGERATRLVQALRERRDLGMDVVGWAGTTLNDSLTRETLGSTLLSLKAKREVDRVIVALGDRRGKMPVGELLDLRLSNIKIEEATGLLEQISGKINVDELHPSWLIFSEGFRLKSTFMFVRRVVSCLAALACLMVCLPLIPLIVLAIKLTSPGPVLYRQKRVGRNGIVFNCYKFRTMFADAEVDTGPTWASDDDPRITPLGRFLRRSRLDEIPQLLNVLRGDMGFVGPRPERPEFVARLSREIPYYHLRHIIRPGITGWAQIRYRYGNSVEDAKEKLEYDLYYIKNLSLGLDFLILFETVKVIVLGRGAK